MHLCITDLQGEIPHNPQKLRKVCGKILAVLLIAALRTIHANELGEVDHQPKILDRHLADRPCGVVDEVGRQEEREGKDATVMVCVGVEGACMTRMFQLSCTLKSIFGESLCRDDLKW